MRSNILVNDGQWHDVKAQFNPAYMEVSVDGEKKSLRPRVGENKHIDLVTNYMNILRADFVLVDLR